MLIIFPIFPQETADLCQFCCQLACVEMRLAECDEETRPIMRLLYRSRCACLWELVDDPDSSRAAWWLSVFLKMVVFINMFLSQNSLGFDLSGPNMIRHETYNIVGARSHTA